MIYRRRTFLCVLIATVASYCLVPAPAALSASGHDSGRIGRFGVRSDPDAAQWQLRSRSGPPGRWSAATAFDTIADRMLIFGGVNAGFQMLDDTWAWSGSAWSELDPATRPPARE